MVQSVLIFVIMVFFCATCQRDFDAPSPQPIIDAFSPEQGYMGDWIEIQGANFDPSAENNLVFFSTNSAQVIEASSNKLVVIAPRLNNQQEAYIKISTSQGQATSKTPFFYNGHGHPVDQTLDRHIAIEWSPIAVSSTHRTALDTPAWITVANSAAKVLSLLNIDSGNHFDFGLQHSPISVATVQTDSNNKTYLTTIHADPGSNLILQSYLKVLSIDFEPGHIIPEIEIQQIDTLPDVYGIPFQPAKVWSICLTSQAAECQKHGIIISHLFAPVLLDWDLETESLISVLTLQNDECPSDQKPLRASTVADLRYDPEKNRLIVVLKDSPEVFSLPMDAGQCPTRIWPTSGAPAADWLYHYTALERLGPIGLSDPKLFLADTVQNVIVELTEKPDGVFSRRSQTALGGAAFSMLVTQTAQDLYRLYAATEHGIFGFDLSRDAPDSNMSPLQLVAVLPVENSTGSVQSLAAVYSELQFDDPQGDEVLFADMSRDELKIFRSGTEITEYRTTQLGHTKPYPAPSHFSNALYVTDPMTNAVRVMDRSSGLQSAQFAILDEASFESKDIACLNAKGADVLLIPLPKTDRLPNTQPIAYNRIVVRRADSEDNIQAWVDKGYDKTPDNTVYVMTTENEIFHTMIPAEHNQAVYLIRYGIGDIPGKLWTLSTNFDATGAGDFLGTKDFSAITPKFGFIEWEIQPHTEFVRISHDQDALITLTRPKTLPPEVYIVPLSDPQAQTQLELQGLLPYLIGDVVSIRSHGSLEPPTHYLSLPQLGQIAALHQGQLHCIETTGYPYKLYSSPDSRRLYATHAKNNKLSIIDIDCRIAPNCENLIESISLDASPHTITFTPSGDSAIISYQDSSSISVIE